MNLDRAFALATAALFGWALGLLCGRFATRSMDALTVESQALQLAQEREASCEMARQLVEQHPVVRNVWPSPPPTAIAAWCDQEGIGQARPVLLAARAHREGRR